MKNNDKINRMINIKIITNIETKLKLKIGNKINIDTKDAKVPGQNLKYPE